MMIQALLHTLLLLYQLEITQSFYSLQLNATNENITSPSFLARAKKIYTNVMNCIEKENPGLLGNRAVYKFPADAESHYRELYAKTAHMRNITMHRHAGYTGPWIENHWISSFENLPLSAFGGLIPVFVQWVDIEVDSSAQKNNYVRYNKTRDEIVSLLRKDVLYVTVSQCGRGLTDLAFRTPNMLVFSAGGYGHIPIPLVLGRMSYYQPTNFLFDVAFFGTIRSGRGQMMQLIQTLADEKQIVFISGHGNGWRNVMLHTKFNLAPRGIGKTSFRLAE
jgi:hypothetical protein